MIVRLRDQKRLELHRGTEGQTPDGVFRDRDTPDGGKAGQMTCDPAEIDAVVKRAWQVIYDGMAGCMQTGANLFFDTYRHVILKQNKKTLWSRRSVAK